MRPGDGNGGQLIRGQWVCLVRHPAVRVGVRASGRACVRAGWLACVGVCVRPGMRVCAREREHACVCVCVRVCMLPGGREGTNTIHLVDPGLCPWEPNRPQK